MVSRSASDKIDLMPAVLYIVATPIGNLGDMTYRAVECCAAHASRVKIRRPASCRPFRHRRPSVSYHEHNEAPGRRDWGWLESGLSVAIVSDAGTPLICTPATVVRSAVARFWCRFPACRR